MGLGIVSHEAGIRCGGVRSSLTGLGLDVVGVGLGVVSHRAGIRCGGVRGSLT